MEMVQKEIHVGNGTKGVLLPKSILTKSQFKKVAITVSSSKLYPEFNGKTLYIDIRYDDACGNGHNSFAITGSCGGNNGIGGRIHDFIVEQAPQYKKFIKWHITSSDGPMHYVANSLYHATCKKLKWARSSAVWPSASLSDFTEDKLLERLPKMMKQFKKAIESLGFEY